MSYQKHMVMNHYQYVMTQQQWHCWRILQLDLSMGDCIFYYQKIKLDKPPATSLMKRKEDYPPLQQEGFIPIVDIDNACKTLDTIIEIAIKSLITLCLGIFPMPTSIPEQSTDALFNLPFPIAKMLEFSIGSGGLLLRGFMCHMALLVIELGAQKCYGLENNNSSVHEWLAYDMKPCNDVKKYIKQIAITPISTFIHTVRNDNKDHR